MILYLKAFHIIAMVAWFAGLFYLPRLFVYHIDAHDDISLERFKIMERRLYFGIMWPAAVITSILGLSLLSYATGYYMQQAWFHWKLLMVACLWVFHLLCGHYLKKFAAGHAPHSSGFYRVFNELPTVILIVTVILVVVKP